MDHSEFGALTSVDDARERLLSLCPAPDRIERVPVGEARGRTLADAVDAPRAVPHYDRAAMDGIAVRASDTFEASDRSPARLAETDGAVAAGQARPVHTGSAIPEGADAVVVIEETARREEGLAVYEAVAVGENVAPAGEDVEAGQRLFDASHRLSPADLGLLRAIGCQEVAVFERPRASVVPTGEEVVAADPAAGEVVETNGLTVSSLVEQWGGTATHRDVVTDDRAALRAAIERDCDHDIVVTTGGSSVGERDLVPEVVRSLGELPVHGVALKPGHPVAIGAVDGTPVLVLPGYPVSCLLGAVQFLRPALAALGGWTPPPQPTAEAELAEKLPSEPGTRSFARVTLSDGDRGHRATPLRVAGAGVLSSVSRADGWVVVPERREGIPAGETVSVQLWDWVWRP
jgi:molybdopterin molybdotransferase